MQWLFTTVEQIPWHRRIPWVNEVPKRTEYWNLYRVLQEWITFFWQKTVFWIPVIRCASNFADNYGGGEFRSRRSPPTGCLRQWFRCTCVQENLSEIKHVKVPCDSVMSRFYCMHYSSYSFEVLGKRTWNAIALTSRQPLLLPSRTVHVLQLRLQFPHKQHTNLPFLKYFHNRNAWTSTDWARSPISLARYKKTSNTSPKNTLPTPQEFSRLVCYM